MKINIQYNNQSAFTAIIKNKDIAIKIVIIDYQHNTELEYSISSFFLIEPNDKSLLNSIQLPKTRDKKLSFFHNLFDDGHNTMFLKEEHSRNKETKIAFYKKLLSNLKGMDIEIHSI